MDIKSPEGVAHTGSTINIPSSPFMAKLGCGTGVSVYRYKRSPEKNGKYNSPWAIKKSNMKASDNIRERLAVEASVLKQIGSHPYIVGFRAFTGTKKGELCLAMEDCERSLMDMIEEKSFLEETFTANQILKVAWCISNALKFLHNSHKLLHGDIKSANVLVRGDFDQVKLCDFGVSLRLKEDLSGLKNKDDIYIGSEPWKPKEAFKSEAITDKSDIYPFGLLLWEMLTLAVPHVNLLDISSSIDSSMSELINTSQSINSFVEDNEEYLNALGTRPSIPNDFIMKDEFMPVVALFHCCTDENPRNRPSAATIVASLEPIIEKMGITP